MENPCENCITFPICNSQIKTWIESHCDLFFIEKMDIITDAVYDTVHLKCHNIPKFVRYIHDKEPAVSTDDIMTLFTINTFKLDSDLIKSIVSRIIVDLKARYHFDGSIDQIDNVTFQTLGQLYNPCK